MKKVMRIVFYSFLLFSVALPWQTEIDDSGGPMMPEQASYDVRYYDLDIAIHPSDSSIDGTVIISADIVHPIAHFVVDLDTLLSIAAVKEIIDGGTAIDRAYYRDVGKVWISLNKTRQAGEKVSVSISYSGRPRIAKRPPWDACFTWARTRDNSPWIATTCQGEGPDLWWPSKDHVSDEPDSMSIHVRVPDPLICASNGRLRSVEKHDDKTHTYHWFVSNPINNYNVALNIAPYKVIEEKYTSTAGDIIPVTFWILPEDYEKGKTFFPEIIKHLNWFEKTLGPYPFRADKYGVAQTPHLGMEHQTIIAYGANFNNAAMVGRDWGFDALHHHELSHEWWGNLVTASDWRDMWIHEGLGTYMQALYLEDTQGIEFYHKYLQAVKNFGERLAIAPRESKTAGQIFRAPIYMKGAWTIHTLRYLIGAENVRRILRRMAYPDPEMETVTDGSQTRFASTEDFINIAEKVSGRELDWFFEVYLRQPQLPELLFEKKEGRIRLAWQTPRNLPFPMPVDIKLGEETKRVDIPADGMVLKVKDETDVEIDPQGWVLFKPAALAVAKRHLEEKNYAAARLAYETALQVEPENRSVQNMVSHLAYAERYPARLNGGHFAAYEGEYEYSPQMKLQFTLEEGRFFVDGNRFLKGEVFPVSDTTFVYATGTRSLNFVTNQSNEAALSRVVFRPGWEVRFVKEYPELRSAKNAFDKKNYRESLKHYQKYAARFPAEKVIAPKMIRHLEYMISKGSEVEARNYEAYAGTYKNESGRTISIMEKMGKLYSIQGRMGDFLLYPVSPTEFFYQGGASYFTFIDTMDGSVQELMIGTERYQRNE